MNSAQRIKNILFGLLTLAMAAILFIDPNDGLIFVALILGFSMLLYGARMLYFYFRMARRMVSGRVTLYLGVILMDFGIFILSIAINKLHLAIYLLVIYAFSGAIDILRGFEAKKLKAPSWKLKLISGFVNIIIAVLCVALLKSNTMIIYLYAAGLVYSAAIRIITAFRKTAIVYIQ